MGKLAKGLWRFGRFAILLLLFLIIVTAIGVIVGPENIKSINQFIDSTWIIVTVIHFAVLIFIALWGLPAWLNWRVNIQSDRVDYWGELLEEAEAQNATFETKEDIGYALNNATQILNSYQTMQQRRWWIVGALFAIEIIVVQLPHYL